MIVTVLYTKSDDWFIEFKQNLKNTTFQSFTCVKINTQFPTQSNLSYPNVTLSQIRSLKYH